jgi:type I restriction enzyme S subunit
MRYRLGELIELSDLRNSDNAYGLDNLKGISIQKVFINTKAEMTGVSLTPYYLVPPDYFAYVTITSRNGEKITLAYNDTEDTYIVSSSYVVFRVSKPETVDSDYLFMYFNRPEFDRYARFNSWGSAREAFSWDDMCDIDINLPPLPVQQKYVAVYKAMLANQRAYEHGLEDLKLTADVYIERLRHELMPVAIGEYIQRHDVRNVGNKLRNVMGISVYKQFRIPTSKVNTKELANYKIVKPRQIGFVQTTHNEKVFAYAFNNTPDDIVISSVNEVLSTDESRLLPEFLSLFFSRTEFDRYARFHSWGSARETFTWNDLIEVKIPIPDIKVQEAIVEIYTAYTTRREINERLKAQIKDLCPILIKGSLEEASA